MGTTTCVICGEQLDQAGRFCRACAGPIEPAGGVDRVTIEIGPARMAPLRVLQWPIIGLLLAAGAVAGMRSAALALDLEDAWRARRAGIVRPAAKLASVDQHLVLAAAVLVAVIGGLWLSWWAVAYANLGPLGIRRRGGPLWAVVAWVVPGVDLVVPQRVADELWKGSDPWAPLGWRARRGSKRAGIVRWWWVSWCASGLFVAAAEAVVLGVRGEAAGVRASGAVAVDALLLASAVASAMAGLAGIALVTGVTARQGERARLMAEAGLLTAP